MRPPSGPLRWLALAGSCALAVAGTAGAAPPPDLALAPFATGISQVVALAQAGDGRLFIVRQTGQILVHDGTQVLGTPFLDIGSLVSCCGEQGLLGLAFHPEYAANGFFFVHYSDAAGDTVIARYQVSGNANVANPASRTVVLTQDQPFSNHNGGQIAFGSDGYLYIALGDGGSGGDPQNNAQNLGTLLGKILRIDVDTLPYTIPPDNPFGGQPAARAEIWALGLRNPWRFSFDRATGDLFVADVGQSAREEIDFQPASSPGGENYGWRRMEGSLCYNPSAGCNDGTLVLPVLEYDHTLGCSVTGGYRYRGSEIAGLAGVYLYSDYCSGRLWGGTQAPNGTWSAVELIDTPYSVVAFGEDQSGELYVADYSSGVYRLTGPPSRLSIGDVSVAEGGGGSAVFTVTLAPASAEAVTVSWATSNGTAIGGSDYVAGSGSVSFPAGVSSRTLSVAVVGDALDEANETFLVSLSGATGATILDGEGQGTIVDDDPTPLLSVGDAVVAEGNGGSVDAVFTVSLAGASAQAVSVSYATGNNTALAGSDYQARSGTVSFPAGSTAAQTVSVPVLGDVEDEPTERFAVLLSAPVNGLVADGEGIGTILDDDGGVFGIVELGHGSEVRADLRVQPGPVADRDLYVVSLGPYSSYEVLVEGSSGDVGVGNGPRVERVGADLTTVAAGSQAVGVGPGRSLRLRNTTWATVDAYVSVRSDSCGTDCGPDDGYRIRAWETTTSIPRFNNVGTQTTVVVLQNASERTVAGTVQFWSGGGVRLAGQGFSLAARATLVLNAASLPALAGQTGAITVEHDGRYGDLAGKAVALEPATGFSFDSPMRARER